MSLRDLPSVDHLLGMEEVRRLIGQYGRPLTVDALRQSLARARRAISDGAEAPGTDGLVSWSKDTLAGWLEPSLQPVVNATGVVLHTNLGRAPLGQPAIKAMVDIAQGYSSLEFDLEQGGRGARESHVESMITRLKIGRAHV